VSHTNTRVAPFGPDSVAEAADLIRAGQCVAVPTETVYGLAADATNADAVARIYAAKGRPSFNPLIVHVQSLAQAEEYGGLFSNTARVLAARFWPGPLTLVVPYRRWFQPDHLKLPDIVRAGLDSVAFRVSAHPAMRDLLNATGRPLAAPSANASGGISPTQAQHVLRSLGGRIELILDAGPTANGVESTILKVSGEELTLLRPGPITLEDLVAFKFQQPTAPRLIESPGQLASHYAPSKPVRLDATEAAPEEYLIGFGPVAGHASLSPCGDPVEAAARLFELLHQADESSYARIAVAPVPAEGLGLAIRDRLARAAHRERS
jgi:L-threonylcarbamoyladenylate synthase